jgi:hypothetical protein
MKKFITSDNPVSLPLPVTSIGLLPYTGRIDPRESLFTYPVGMSPANFSFPDHTPPFEKEVVDGALPEDIEMCMESPRCIFDATQTGILDVGLETMEMDEMNHQNQMIACEYVYHGTSCSCDLLSKLCEDTSSSSMYRNKPEVDSPCQYQMNGRMQPVCVCVGVFPILVT